MPEAPDDQPDPNANDLSELTPKQLHKKAIVRLANLHARAISESLNFDTVLAQSNIATLQCDLAGLVTCLIAKNVFTADEFYTAAGVIAIDRGNKLFAKLHTPKIAVPDGVNGTG